MQGTSYLHSPSSSITKHLLPLHSSVIAENLFNSGYQELNDDSKLIFEKSGTATTAVEGAGCLLWNINFSFIKYYRYHYYYYSGGTYFQVSYCHYYFLALA